MTYLLRPAIVLGSVEQVNAAISIWAFDAAGQMQATGIMGGIGNNTLAPKND